MWPRSCTETNGWLQIWTRLSVCLLHNWEPLCSVFLSRSLGYKGPWFAFLYFTHLAYESSELIHWKVLGKGVESGHRVSIFLMCRDDTSRRAPSMRLGNHCGGRSQDYSRKPAMHQTGNNNPGLCAKTTSVCQLELWCCRGAWKCLAISRESRHSQATLYAKNSLKWKHMQSLPLISKTGWGIAPKGIHSVWWEITFVKISLSSRLLNIRGK